MIVTLAFAAACGGSSTSSHPISTSRDQTSTLRSATQLMQRAGFEIGQRVPRLATNWPAGVRKRCTAVVYGFDSANNTNMLTTLVCKSPA
jgi:hypothetical protein